MKKYKYFLILFTLILIAIFLKLKSITGKSNTKQDIIEAVNEVNSSEEIQAVLTKFDDFYNANIEESNAVGGAVVITYKGQIAFIKCYGVQKAGKKSPVNENTIFRLASVSKTITGVLAGILTNEKQLNLDEKVVGYLPDFNLKFPESTNNITIKHLLSHTSGLIPYAFDTMVEDQVPLMQIMQRLKEVEIVAPPGQIYAYQNVMFSLFDPILTAKTKKSFQTNLREKVLEPFGMKDASTDFKSFQSNKNKAFPHQKTEKGFVPIRLNNRYYNTAPAAGINASISDMGQFLIAISGKDDKLFPKSAREIVFAPQVVSPLKRSYYRNWNKIKTKQYAIGWRIIDYKNHTIAQHGGYVSGYQSEIAVCEEEQIGIAILTNSPNSFFSEIVPTFFNLLFEYQNQLKQENLVSKEVPISKP